MKRRGFLSLLAGAAVTPLAKAIPDSDPWVVPSIFISPPKPALDLAAFDAVLKEVYRDRLVFGVGALTYSRNPFLDLVRVDPRDIDAGELVDVRSKYYAALNRKTEESADGEGQCSASGEGRLEGREAAEAAGADDGEPGGSGTHVRES